MIRPVKVLFWSSRGWIAAMIKRVTLSPWTHVAIYIGGYTWEFDEWGVHRSRGVKSCNVVKEPRRELTQQEHDAILAYWIEVRRKGRWYNVGSLLSLLVVYPLRRLFERLGWVPFQAPYWGRVCSTAVDESFRAAGIDLVPKRSELLVSPGDVYESELWR